MAAVQAANLTDVLSLAGPIDVFAPTNDAFGTLLATLDVTAEPVAGLPAGSRQRPICNGQAFAGGDRCQGQRR